MRFPTWNLLVPLTKVKYPYKKGTENMKVEITARHFSPSDHLKELVHEKIKKIEKYNNGIMDCRVILTKEHNEENVEIMAHAKGHDFVAQENADVFERALVNAINKITIQVKKQHEKQIVR